MDDGWLSSCQRHWGDVGGQMLSPRPCCPSQCCQGLQPRWCEGPSARVLVPGSQPQACGPDSAAAEMARLAAAGRYLWREATGLAVWSNRDVLSTAFSRRVA